MIAITVLAWVVVVSVLHARLNHGRRHVTGAAATVEVGGLPVT